MISVSDYVIDFFDKIKSKHVFTVSGGGSIFLCDSLKRSQKVQYISCHHEQAVSFAAESYARQRNQIAAAVVTTGPGGTNAITGVASCWIDSIPVMFVSGQVFLNQTIRKTGLRQLGVQEIDIISLVKPITKYAAMIEDENTIKYHLEKAYYEAITGRPGPVWLDIPANIQSKKINQFKLNSFKKIKNKKSYLKIDENKIIKIANLINQSKRPLLHFGQGVKLSKAENEARSLINKFNLPFALTWNASDLIETTNKYYSGRPGAFAERGSNFIVQNCDVFLSIGSKLPFMVTGYNSKDFARNAKRITVDIDEKEISKKNIDFHIRLKLDAKDFFQRLHKYLKRKNNRERLNWLNYCNYIRKKFPIVLESYKKQKKFVNSYYFIDCLSDILKPNNTVVTDMGLSFVGTHQAFKVKKNQKLFTNSGHAPMGWGLPAAVGASFARNKKQVICLTGDGGLQMNIQELATIMHHKLPIKIFIYNNGGYLTIKQTQELGFNRRIMGSNSKSGLSFPKYSNLAKSYKIKYVKINNQTNLKQKIKQIIEFKKAVICELIMDPSQEQMPKAINRRDKDGRTVPTTFEDMYPFLPRKEILESSFENYIDKLRKGII